MKELIIYCFEFNTSKKSRISQQQTWTLLLADVYFSVLLSGKKESTKTKKRRRNKDNDEGEVISEDECETVEETPQVS